MEERVKLIIEIKNKELPLEFKSSAWEGISEIDINNISCVSKIMTRSWLVGFIEAKGSFYLVKKSNKPLGVIHCFGITQKLDRIVLCVIKTILNIKGNVLLSSNKNIYKLDTSKDDTIKYIIDYFITKNNKSLFKGVKSLDFAIWKKSYFKYKGDPEKLLKIRDIIRKLKKKN